MKEQFINQLKDEKILSSENRKAFEQLPQNLFEPFNDTIVSIEKLSHRWQGTYFPMKVADLKFNFSKELIEHLLTVKQFLEDKYLSSSSSKTASVEIIQSISSESESVQAVQNKKNFAKPDLFNFKPSAKLAENLNEGDISKIRSYLMSMLNNRRLSLDELFKSIWYVHQYHGNIFESEAENAFVQEMDNDETNWNIAYFSRQQIYLNQNFSLARLLHLANVRETLMKKGDKDFQQIEVEKSKSEQVNYSQSHNQSQTKSDSFVKQESQPEMEEPSHNSFVKTLLMVGGAVLAIGVALFSIFK